MFRHFVLIYQNHVTSSPGVLHVAYCPFFWHLHCNINIFSTYRKLLSNLVNATAVTGYYMYEELAVALEPIWRNTKCRNIWMNNSLFCVILDMKMEQSNCGNY